MKIHQNWGKTEKNFFQLTGTCITGKQGRQENQYMYLLKHRKVHHNHITWFSLQK